MINKNFDERKFLSLIQKTLLYGTILSAILLFLGFLLHFIYNKNYGIVSFGILVLIATPVLRVFMLLYGFFRLKEYNFAMASFIVIVLMLVSVLI